MKKPERILWVLSALIVILVVVALVKQFGSSSDPAEKPDAKPAPSSVNNVYFSKYAGGYTVEVNGNTGTDIESYVLRYDGIATWM